LPLPDKPSIVVLPFVNMSDDPKQEYFSDGITEDITKERSILTLSELETRLMFMISWRTLFGINIEVVPPERLKANE
jgi:TolB-like protein